MGRPQIMLSPDQVREVETQAGWRETTRLEHDSPSDVSHMESAEAKVQSILDDIAARNQPLDVENTMNVEDRGT